MLSRVQNQPKENSPFNFDEVLASVCRDIKELNQLERHVHKHVTQRRTPTKSPMRLSNLANVKDKSCSKNGKFRTLPHDKENNENGSPTTLKLPKEIRDFSSQIAALASRIKEWVYCPLCPLRYRKDVSLSLHVKSQHVEELVALKSKSYSNFTYQNCPSCNAKFFKLGVLARHLTLYHSETVLDIWDAANHQRKSCYFCKKPFEGTKTDIIINHVVSEHAEQFETLALIFLKKKLGESSVKTNDISQLLSPGATRSILRSSTAPNKSAKRALRFSVPEAVCHFYENPSSGSSASEESKVETSAQPAVTVDEQKCEESSQAFEQLSVSFNSPSPRFCGLGKAKKAKPKFTSTPVKRQRKNLSLQSRVHCLFHTALSPHSPSKLYRCAACRLRFNDNADLLDHMKIHNGFHTKVRPLFSCGACNAQFYKNEFLLKHCSEHHFRYVNTPPKCIKARDVLFNNVSNFSPLM